MRKSAIGAILGVLMMGAVPVAAAQQIHRLSTQADLLAIGTSEVFEVLTRAGMGKADYYCAAGDFAWVRLNATNNDRLVVVYSRSPSQFVANRSAIGFRLAGPDTKTRSNWFLGPREGQVRSVGHARGLCNVARANRRLDDKD
jgi:hypothetical protein